VLYLGRLRSHVHNASLQRTGVFPAFDPFTISIAPSAPILMMPINLPSFKEFCTNSGVALPFHRVFRETPDKLKAHISPCNKCNKCGKRFKRPFNLRRHEKIHNKDLEQLHRCSICSSGFLRRADLNRHENVNNPAVLPFRLMLTFDRRTRPNVLTNVVVGPVLAVRII
jgi:hypothetical protein